MKTRFSLTSGINVRITASSGDDCFSVVYIAEWWLSHAAMCAVSLSDAGGTTYAEMAAFHSWIPT